MPSFCCAAFVKATLPLLALSLRLGCRRRLVRRLHSLSRVYRVDAAPGVPHEPTSCRPAAARTRRALGGTVGTRRRLLALCLFGSVLRQRLHTRTCCLSSRLSPFLLTRGRAGGMDAAQHCASAAWREAWFVTRSSRGGSGEGATTCLLLSTYEGRGRRRGGWQTLWSSLCLMHARCSLYQNGGRLLQKNSMYKHFLRLCDSVPTASGTRAVSLSSLNLSQAWHDAGRLWRGAYLSARREKAKRKEDAA